MPRSNSSITTPKDFKDQAALKPPRLNLDREFSAMLATHGISEQVFERNPNLLQYITNSTPLDVVLKRATGTGAMSHREAWQVYCAMNLWQAKHGFGLVDCGNIRAYYAASANRVLALLGCSEVPAFDVDHTSHSLFADARGKFGAFNRLKARVFGI